MNLVCGVECVDRHTVYRVAGEIDLATANELRQAAVAAMDEQAPSLTLDLTSVTFMDCAGLGALVFVRAEAERRQGHLTLSHVPGSALRLLRLAHIDAHLGVEESDVPPHRR